MFNILVNLEKLCSCFPRFLLTEKSPYMFYSYMHTHLTVYFIVVKVMHTCSITTLHYAVRRLTLMSAA